ncbi:MAG: TerB family tellurite resistance protein [Alkalispirochaeta sp.]
MSWFGKLLGGTVGLFIGGPLGAIAGGAIGHHLFDKEGPGAGDFRPGAGPFGGGATTGTRSGPFGGTAPFEQRRSSVEERKAAYFLALFSLLGKLAKADGRVTREEGEMVVSFLDRMGVRGEERQFAIRVFNEAKDSPYSAEEFAGQFAAMTAMQRDLRSSMVDMLFQIALADGEFHPQEERMISSIAGILGISAGEYNAFRARYVETTDHAYSVLGLTRDADDETVKSTYRRLVQEYHPDRIISQGMPEEFVEYATKRFQEVQTAWDQIRKERGL